jgi:hypothetical protein
MKHNAMRLQGDAIVNNALDNTISRASQYVRKGSSLVRAKETHLKAMHTEKSTSTAMQKNCERNCPQHHTNGKHKAP